ncbi:hypothetical protein LSH36_988g00073, partial [Paralvinella palmiformis]
MNLAKSASCFGARLLAEGPLVNKRMTFLYNGAFKAFDSLYAAISKHFYNSQSNNNYKKHISVSIEGNIGSGKTSLLNYFSHFPDAEVLMEPVARWQDIDGLNAL